jgi:hypothetical protein
MKTWNRDGGEERRLKRSIRDLVTQRILELLNRDINSGRSLAPWGTDDLERLLNDDFDAAITGRRPEQAREPGPGVRWASVLARSDSHSINLYVVGYVIPHGTTSRDVIQCFAREPDGYVLAAEGGSEMDDHVLSLAAIGSLSSDQNYYFFASGVAWGGNQSPLSAVVYRYADQAMTEIWSRKNVRLAQAVVLNNGVVVFSYPAWGPWGKEGSCPNVVQEYLLIEGTMKQIGSQCF